MMVDEELLIRSVRGEADSAEIKRLEEWRRESPENEEQYRDLQSLIHLSVSTAATSRIPTEPPPTEEILRIVDERMRERPDFGSGAGPADCASSPPFSVRFRARIGRRTPGAIFARVVVIAALLLVSFVVTDRWWAGDPEAPVGTMAQGQEYRTGPDAGQSIRLEDGTLMHLGPSSSLTVVRVDPEPEFWLEGRAFFGVAQQAEDRRVVVGTPGGRVTVLGTRFDVQSSTDELKVLVVDGRVGVSVDEEEGVEVGSQEAGAVREGIIQAVVLVEDPLRHLDWMGQAMVFQSTPLDRVIDEVELRYGVEIELLDTELAERTVTVAFNGEPFEQVMDIVCRVVHVSCTVEGEQATITDG